MNVFTDQEKEAIRRAVDGLVRQGYTPPAARNAVCRAACRLKGSADAGVGAPADAPAPAAPLSTEEQALKDIAAAAANPIVAEVRGAISPWLWVTSVVGFVTGLLNTRRIGKMYKDWRGRSEAGRRRMKVSFAKNPSRRRRRPA